MASYGSDTAPYIVGATSCLVVVVTLVWYLLARIKVKKTIGRLLDKPSE